MVVTAPHRAPGQLPLTAGRRAALVIGVPVCLLLVAMTGLNLVATFGQGSYAVNYAPAGARSLTVHSDSGQLLVQGGTGSGATVDGTAHYSLVRSKVTEHATGSGVAIGYQCVIPVGNCGLDATVTAPAAVAVSAATGGGNAAVLGTAGPVSLSTGGGDISASDTAGPLTLDTDGGNIVAGATRSVDVTAASGGGDVGLAFTVAPSDVHVDTSGGNITITVPDGPVAYRVITHTDGGTISDTVPQNSSSLRVISATTGGGNITIRQQ
jgi:hypothetical protein